MLVQKLNRIFDSHDVIKLGLVNQIDDRRQRRTFSAAGWPHNPDHLPWHGGVEQYYEDKLSACHQPGAEVTVANGDSGLLRDVLVDWFRKKKVIE